MVFVWLWGRVVVGVLKMEDELEVMDGLLDVRRLVLVFMAGDVLDHVAFEEGKIVGVDVLDRLDGHLFVVVPRYLGVRRVTHSRLPE